MTAQQFTRKEPQIQAFQFQPGFTDLQELTEWLNGGPSGPYDATVITPAGNLMVQHTSDPVIMVPNGSYVVRDSNGKVFKMLPELVDAFYDQVV